MNRRQVLGSSGVALASVFAGCTSGSENSSPPDNESETTPDSNEDDTPQGSDDPSDSTSDDGSDESGSESNSETWHGYDVEEVKAEATQPGIDDFVRNMEDYTGESLYFEYAYINQKIEEDGFFQFHLQLSDSGQEYQGDAFGWWEGDRFLEGDNVEIWGVGEGPYEYETVQGDYRTVPAISIVDMKMSE